MTNKWFPTFLKNCFNENISSSDTFKCILVTNLYSFSSLHETYSDVSSYELSSGLGYSTGGEAISITNGLTEYATFFNFVFPIWSSSTFTSAGAIVYKVGIDSNSSHLVYYVDFGANITSTGNFTISKNNTLSASIGHSQKEKTVPVDQYATVLNPAPNIFDIAYLGHISGSTVYTGNVDGYADSLNKLESYPDFIHLNSLGRHINSISKPTGFTDPISIELVDRQNYLLHIEDNVTNQFYLANNTTFQPVTFNSTDAAPASTQKTSVVHVGGDKYICATGDGIIQDCTLTGTSLTCIDKLAIPNGVSNPVYLATSGSHTYICQNALLNQTTIFQDLAVNPLGAGFFQFDISTGDYVPGAPPFKLLNGNINAIQSDGSGGFIIGGSFTSVIGISSSTGLLETFTRNRILRLDSLMRITSWDPNFGSTVNAIAVDTVGEKVYVAGSFTNHVGAAPGGTRSRVTRLSLSTGLHDGWSPIFGVTRTSPDRSCYALYFDSINNILYVGGEFLAVAGQIRRNMFRCSVSPSTSDGVIDVWDPNIGIGSINPYNEVWDIIPYSTDIFICGRFSTIGPAGTQVTRNNIARILADPLSTSATIQSWNAGVTGGSSTSQVLYSMQIQTQSGVDWLWVGGNGSINRSSRRGLMKFRANNSNMQSTDPNIFTETTNIVYSIKKFTLGGVDRILCLGNFTDTSVSITAQSNHRGIITVNASNNTRELNGIRSDDVTVSGASAQVIGDKILIGLGSANRVYYANIFVGPSSTSHLVRIDSTNFQIDNSFRLFLNTLDTNYWSINGIKIINNELYAWGRLSSVSFNSIVKLSRMLIKINLTTNQVTNSSIVSYSSTTDTINDILVTDDYVYVVGSFTRFTTPTSPKTTPYPNGSPHIARLHRSDLVLDWTWIPTVTYSSSHQFSRIISGWEAEGLVKEASISKDTIYARRLANNEPSTSTSSTVTVSTVIENSGRWLKFEENKYRTK